MPYKEADVVGDELAAEGESGADGVTDAETHNDSLEATEGKGASEAESVPLLLTEPLAACEAVGAMPDPEGNADCDETADGLAALRVVETDGEAGALADVVDEAVSTPGVCVAPSEADTALDGEAAERVDEIEGEGAVDADVVSLG